MKNFMPCFNGILPKPTKKLVGKKILYYVAAGDRHFVESRTPDVEADVVTNALQCQKESPAPPDVPNANVTVFPAMPPGFSAGGIGTGMVGVLAGGAAAAAGGVAVASSSNDKPPSPTVPPRIPPRIPPTGGVDHGPEVNCRVNPAPPQGPSPLDVVFDMCGTTDPDGDAIKYRFDFGDSATFQGICRAKHTYSYPPGPSTAVATICASDGTRSRDACCQYKVMVRNSCANDERPPNVSLQVPSST
jgi:hypothetical protein